MKMAANPQLTNRPAPLVGHASELAQFTADGFGRRVLFDTERFRVILVAFERDQEIPIHAPAVDLALAVLEGTGELFAGDAVYDLRAGDVAVIPAGQTRGLRARGGRLVALHVVSPPPTAADHAAVAAGAAWPASEAAADPAAAIAAEHAELLPHLDHLRDLAARIDEIDEPALRSALEEILAFLRDGILPHAAAEEKALYPEIDGLLRAAGGATATMSMDHQEIGRLVEELATAQARAGGVDREGARRLLYSLEAILRLHFSKETEVYLPLLQRLSGREAAALLEALGAVPGGHHH
ncbi:MAG TPA: hemerythrin domain-containing protein [Candidatus Dormibacteraeota bacterium]|nr:hemerythrin domain-containing protein [Candidatus Dormibacteraeota bacterium]